MNTKNLLAICLCLGITTSTGAEMPGFQDFIREVSAPIINYFKKSPAQEEAAGKESVGKSIQDQSTEETSQKETGNSGKTKLNTSYTVTEAEPKEELIQNLVKQAQATDSMPEKKEIIFEGLGLNLHMNFTPEDVSILADEVKTSHWVNRYFWHDKLLMKAARHYQEEWSAEDYDVILKKVSHLKAYNYILRFKNGEFVRDNPPF